MNQQQMQIKISDKTMKGSYANMMMVSHTQEEFVLDFMNVVPSQNAGVVTSRVVTSPGHLKRIIAALSDNLKKYEGQFGKITEAKSPAGKEEVGFKVD